jgi:hypothetical protein
MHQRVYYSLYYYTIYINVRACVRDMCIILYTKGRTIPMAVAVYDVR